MAGIVTAQELKGEIDSGKQQVLLDVREPDEVEVSCLAGIRHIPMGEVPDRLDELDKSQPIVVICRSGGRSGRIAEFLSGQGFTDVRNFVGGMQAWARENDPSMTVA